MTDTGLKDKTVLITGAQHGIGAAAARAFTAEGATVFVHYFRVPRPRLSNEAGKTSAPGEALFRERQAMSADEVIRSIRKHAGKADSWEADLADPGTVPALFDHAEKQLGPVQVLVNNAAHWEADTFLGSDSELPTKTPEPWPPRSRPLTLESYERHFAVNTRAVALLMAEFVRRYTQRGLTWGRIINVSTDAAYCFPGEVSYGASKAALEAYTRSAAVELGKLGITVNIVAPGPTQTGWITLELEEAILPFIPLRRLGQPEDVADVIVFLASEQAR